MCHRICLFGERYAATAFAKNPCSLDFAARQPCAAVSLRLHIVSHQKHLLSLLASLGRRAAIAYCCSCYCLSGYCQESALPQTNAAHRPTLAGRPFKVGEHSTQERWKRCCEGGPVSKACKSYRNVLKTRGRRPVASRARLGALAREGCADAQEDGRRRRVQGWSRQNCWRGPGGVGVRSCVEIKILQSVRADRRVDLHAIDATPAR